MRGPDGGPAAGSLTELAALEAARDEKRQLLERAAEARASRRSAPCPPAARPTTCPRCCSATTGASPRPRSSGTSRRSSPTSRWATCGSPRSGRRARRPSTRSGSRTAGPSMRLVTDDMPYLVDSVTAEVVRQGFALAHIVHPVVVVRRDLRGQILAFCDSNLAAGCGADALTESWMAVVLDGPLDEEAGTDLVAGLRTVLDDVRAVDEDAERLRARVRELADRLDELPAPPPPRTSTRRTTPPRPRRCCAGWPTATSSSSAPGTSSRSPVAASGSAAVVPGTGLGVLRSDTDMSEPAARMPERRPDAGPAADHRHQGRHPLAGVPAGLAGPGRGQPAARRRRPGAAAPLRRAVPVRGVHEQRRRRPAGAAPGGRGRRPAPASRPTATPARSCSRSSRPTPATSCSRSAPTSCCPSPSPSCTCRSAGRPGCSSARTRPGGSGRRWSTCRATGTRPRCGWRMQQVLLERLGGTSIEYTARSTESVLARLHFVVRLPVGRRGATEAGGRRRRGAAGRARRGGPQLDRRALRRAARPVRRRRRAAPRPRRRRLPGRLPGGLLRRAGRRRPGAAGRAGRGAAGAAAVDARGAPRRGSAG